MKRTDRHEKNWIGKTKGFTYPTTARATSADYAENRKGEGRRTDGYSGQGTGGEGGTDNKCARLPGPTAWAVLLLHKEKKNVPKKEMPKGGQIKKKYNNKELRNGHSRTRDRLPTAPKQIFR